MEVIDDGAEASSHAAAEAEEEPAAQEAQRPTPAPSPPSQAAVHSPVMAEQGIAPSTARLWALQAPDRQRATDLLSKQASGSTLTVKEWLSLRAILAQLVLTLVS